MVAGLIDGLDRIPAHLLRSITFDQGSEWANWETIADSYKIKIWFCDPHSPWQRGQVENLNRQWRWWFPRSTDLASIAPAAADHAATITNGQRLRHLDRHSPAALYAAATCSDHWIWPSSWSTPTAVVVVSRGSIRRKASWR